MNRKDLFLATAAGAVAFSRPNSAEAAVDNRGNALKPPAHGPVNVALVMGPNLVTIDLFGPATVFGDANFDGTKMVKRFNLYTVSASTKPLAIDFGKMQANYAFDNAPQPQVLVIPMQDSLQATIAYVKRASVGADVTMSVCTGAFLAARAGLFTGGRATTHHDAYDAFAKEFPKVQLVKDLRYVEDPKVSSSGGESCGIDLALRVVERYYGPESARITAYNMEYRRSARPSSLNEV
jgi:transcriptional regulator GlxA family with amidase domain